MALRAVRRAEQTRLVNKEKPKNIFVPMKPVLDIKRVDFMRKLWYCYFNKISRRKPSACYVEKKRIFSVENI